MSRTARRVNPKAQRLQLGKVTMNDSTFERSDTRLNCSACAKRDVPGWVSGAILRDQLVHDGRLVDAPSSELFTFARDVVFSSPSAAASIVAARSASGPRAGKLARTGEMYKDWKAEKFDSPITA